MWAVSNLFRASAAIRRHMEAKVLAHDRLSWTSFAGLWVLWVWGEMEARDFAAAVGISRPTATGVITTLEGRRFVRRKKDPRDGRMVLVSLTAAGTRKIEQLFPLFNAEEVEVIVRTSTRAQQDALAAMLRSMLPRRRTERRAVRPGLVERDADRHPLDAVHEVRADPLDRTGELDRRRVAAAAPGTGSSSPAARGARPDRSAGRRGRT